MTVPIARAVRRYTSVSTVSITGVGVCATVILRSVLRSLIQTICRVMAAGTPGVCFTFLCPDVDVCARASVCLCVCLCVCLSVPMLMCHPLNQSRCSDIQNNRPFIQ